MTDKKNQHYVPQSYLARWTDESDLLDVFKKETGVTFRSIPRNVASQNYFYDAAGDEPRVENILGRIEEEVARKQAALLKDLQVRRRGKGPLQRQLLYRSDKWSFALNIALQVARTERTRDSLGMVDPEAARLRHLRLMSGPHLTGFAEDLMTYIWVIGLVGDGHSLYTSDNPAWLVGPARVPETGVPRLAEIIYPLSPKCVLWLHNRDLHKNKVQLNGRAVLLTNEQIVHCNQVQSIAAHQFVFATTSDFAMARRIRALERSGRARQLLAE